MFPPSIFYVYDAKPVEPVLTIAAECCPPPLTYWILHAAPIIVFDVLLPAPPPVVPPPPPSFVVVVALLVSLGTSFLGCNTSWSDLPCPHAPRWVQ